VAPRSFCNTACRLGRTPWEIGERQEPVDLVTSQRLRSCRAIDLGCGTGANAVFLARHGFDVTSVDFSLVALAKATATAEAAGVAVRFVEDDLTALRHQHGTFDRIEQIADTDRPRMRRLIPGFAAYLSTRKALA